MIYNEVISLEDDEYDDSITSDDCSCSSTSYNLSTYRSIYSPDALCNCDLDDYGCCIDVSDFTVLSEVFDNVFADNDSNASKGTILGRVSYTFSKNATYDWVIIGAGAGGLYLANALLQNDPTLNIKIIEQLDRIGGRLFTLNLEYVPTGGTIDLELGGMRFLDSHEKLNKLLTWVNICDKKELFTHGTRSNQNPYYLRGYRFTVGESYNESSYWTQAFNILDSENCTKQGWPGGWPMCYYVRVFDVLKQQNDPTGSHPTSPQHWQNIRNHWNYTDDKNQSYSLNAISLTVLLRKMGFSKEAMALMAGSGGFVTSFFQSEVNAGDALQLYVAEYFDPETTFYTLKGGFDKIAAALYDNLVTLYSDSFDISTGYNVTRIDYYPHFYEIRSNSIHTRGQTQKDFAHNVAITMDSGQLQRQFAGFNPIKTSYVRSLIYGVTEQRLSKINLIFDNELGKYEEVIYNGGSFTDTEIASFYMVDAWRNGSFFAAVIYCDYYNSDFWWSLYDEYDPYPFNDSALNTYDGDNLATQWNASNSQVDMALDLLNQMFNLTFAKPLAAFYSPWGTGTRYGGSTNFYTVGVNDEVLQEQIWQPLKNHSIYICNEAYSDAHGWVEGTLQSCNNILQGIGVPIPYSNFTACPSINSTNGTTAGCVNGFSADRWTCLP